MIKWPRASCETQAMVGAAIAAGLVATCSIPCEAEGGAATASMEIARPIGDIYNERTTDGDAYPQSIGIRGRWVRDHYALVLDYRRNVYQSETRGAGTFTSYARIEGGTGSTAPFLARESSFEARLERIVDHRSLAVGIGVLRTWANYNYPSLTGLGVGVERSPVTSPGVRPFGSVFYYPAVTGSYTSEGISPRTTTPAFRILKMDYGIVVRGSRTRLFLVAGYGNEFRRGNGLPAEIRFIRSDPYVAIGTHAF